MEADPVQNWFQLAPFTVHHVPLWLTIPPPLPIAAAPLTLGLCEFNKKIDADQKNFQPSRLRWCSELLAEDGLQDRAAVGILVTVTQEEREGYRHIARER